MQRIRERREAMGWSQQKLADEVGCSQQAIASWEKSKRTLRGDILVRLAVALNVQPGYLTEDLPTPGRADRLPQQWVQAVEEFIAMGLTPVDAHQAVRSWLVARGRESTGQPLSD